MEHDFLNLIGKNAQVRSQSVEQFPFRFIRSEVSDPGAIGCVPAELFQMGLIILHGASDFYFGGCSSVLTQPVAASDFSGSGRSQSTHCMVRLPLPPGGNARIKKAPHSGQVGRSAWPMPEILTLRKTTVK